MTSEMKNKVRPFYSEFQGYLSQAPSASEPYEALNDKALWDQYNEAVEQLSSETAKDYRRFKIEPINGGYEGGFIRINTYRQKLGGLISRLHAEYFSNEPAPFSGMPSTIITQTQQQGVSIQMLLDVQSQIDETLSKSEKGSKQEGFLKKLKSTLSSVSNVNELIKQIMKLAKEFGLTVQDIISLWSG